MDQWVGTASIAGGFNPTDRGVEYVRQLGVIGWVWIATVAAARDYVR